MVYSRQFPLFEDTGKYHNIFTNPDYKENKLIVSITSSLKLNI